MLCLDKVDIANSIEQAHAEAFESVRGMDDLFLKYDIIVKRDSDFMEELLKVGIDNGLGVLSFIVMIYYILRNPLLL